MPETETKSTSEPTKEQIAEWQKNKRKCFEELFQYWQDNPTAKEEWEKTTEGIQHPYH